MKNIYYFKRICKIGGTEQFLYEIAKMYHDFDITIYYDEADKFQLKRLQKYLKCKKRKPGEKVECDRAFFNFNIDMIDDVISRENYYCFVSHAIYQELGYKPPINHPKLNHFIGVSQYSCDKLEEFANKLGLKIKAEKCYNPLTLEPKEKVPILVSAARLDDKTKGGQRTLELIKALDKYCEKNNRHYLWLIFTNKTNFSLESPNCVYMEPRVDIRPYLSMANFIVSISNNMETYCYTNNEALGYGIPIVTTPLTVNKELPIDDNMQIILNWDCSNVDEVARQIFEKEVKPFKYIPPKSSWEKFLAKGENPYKYDPDAIVEVRATKKYFDIKLQKYIEKDEIFKVKLSRAEELEEKVGIEIL